MQLPFPAIGLVTIFLFPRFYNAAIASESSIGLESRGFSGFGVDSNDIHPVSENQKRAATNLPKGVEPSAGCQQCKSSLSFTGEKAKKYAVGTQIPGLPFKTKNSWAGNVPIESDKVKNGSLFFWMWGKDDVKAGDDLVIWLNGGPGCSSLFGLSQENGPFHVRNDAKDTNRPSEYSWTRISNIVYVEQPAHVGFSTGRTYFTNETQIAKEFSSFLHHFYEIFPELKTKKLWLVGESYAGYYIPEMIMELNRDKSFPQLQGSLIVDGLISQGSLLEPPTYPFVVKNRAAFKFSNEDMKDIKDEADACGLVDYVERNLHYPAKGPLPDFDLSCSPWSMMLARAGDINENFSVYNVKKPFSSNEDGIDYLDKFFDNPELQNYIHAPRKNWEECSYVFIKGDQSDPPDSTFQRTKSLLAEVIEKSKKTILINGNLDARIMTNQTALALQNLTWGGTRGFSKPPSKPLYDIDGVESGAFTEERGLTFAQIYDSGHMVPKDQPKTGFAALMHLLGQKDWSKK